MQVFGNFFGRKFLIDVEEDTTFEDFGKEVLRRVGAPLSVPFDVKHGLTVCVLSARIRATPSVTAMDTLNISPREVKNRAVEEKLQAFLRICASEIGPRELTFIGVGCFDNNHNRAAALRQQCPPALLECCLRERIDLNIILIDPGFEDEEADSYQACGLGGWLPTFQEEDGKVRQYMQQTALAGSRCDMWMTVFAIPVDEYLTFDKSKTVAGVNVAQAFSAVGSHEACALVCGNFYSEADPPYFTRGDEALLARAGFKPKS